MSVFKMDNSQILVLLSSIFEKERVPMGKDHRPILEDIDINTMKYSHTCQKDCNCTDIKLPYLLRPFCQVKETVFEEYDIPNSSAMLSKPLCKFMSQTVLEIFMELGFTLPFKNKNIVEAIVMGPKLQDVIEGLKFMNKETIILSDTEISTLIWSDYDSDVFNDMYVNLEHLKIGGVLVQRLNPFCFRDICPIVSMITSCFETIHLISPIHGGFPIPSLYFVGVGYNGSKPTVFKKDNVKICIFDMLNQAHYEWYRRFYRNVDRRKKFIDNKDLMPYYTELQHPMRKRQEKLVSSFVPPHKRNHNEYDPENPFPTVMYDPESPANIYST